MGAMQRLARTGCSWCVAGLVSATVLGCAAPKPAPFRAPSSSAGFPDHAMKAAAESARARAVAAETDGAPGVIRGVQLRTSGISARDVADGTGIGGGVRVLLERPWRVRAEAEGGKAEQQAAQFRVTAAEMEARALTCDESVQGRANAERAAVTRAHATQLERVLAWTIAFREAGTLDPITASRTELLVQRRLLADATQGESFRVHETLGALPEVATPTQGGLDRSPAHVAERIRTQHPNVQAHLSRAEQNRQLSSVELGRRIPWFNFVQLDYGIDGQGFRDLQGRVALEIPLDDGSRGRSERYAELGVSEDYAAEGEAALLTRQALVALQALRAFEAQTERLAALEAQATRAESLATRFMEERREGPDKVAQLLGETYAGRMLVLDARERAGRASCSLEWATGASYAAWPRVTGEEPKK